jgi:hypothetical protein
VRRAYHRHVPIILKSGSLNLLEPSGPVQACNGLALPFTFMCNKNIMKTSIGSSKGRTHLEELRADGKENKN